MLIPAPVIETILERFLYKEEVQQLLAEHGEPVTGHKEELIVRLLSSEGFDPSEAVAFLDKAALQRLCAEVGIEPRGTRAELCARILQRIAHERGDEG